MLKLPSEISVVFDLKLIGKTACVFGYENTSKASEKTKYHLRKTAQITINAIFAKSIMGKTSMRYAGSRNFSGLSVLPQNAINAQRIQMKLINKNVQRIIAFIVFSFQWSAFSY